MTLSGLLLLLTGCASVGVTKAMTTSGTSKVAAASGSVSQIVDEVMSRLTLRQKIGQHFIGWIPRGGPTKEIDDLVSAGEIGGFILYPWNYSSVDGAKSLISSLQGLAQKSNPEMSLFFACDQEGGRVAGFRFPQLVNFPAEWYMGHYDDPEMIRSMAYIVAVELKSIGINMNFAPVLGLHAVPDHSIIGDRSFGPDPNIVAGLAKAYVEGARAGGIIAVAKHFPGHGATTVDSHSALPVISLSADVMLNKEIVPFQAAVNAGVEAIMTAHVLYPALDDTYPATLSKKIVTGLLRKTMGFKGVVITDGLAMGALSKNFSLSQTLIHCFHAGINILLIHSTYDVMHLIDMVEADVQSGAVDESIIDSSLVPILRLKAEHGLLGASAGEP